MTAAPAIALDRLLRHPELPNHLDQARAHLRAAGYGWLLDQGDAAAHETHTHMRDLADHHHGEVIARPVDDHPEWVRLALISTLADWITGKARTCLHSPDPRRPQPVQAAAWKPGVIACRHCTHLFALPADSPKNWTCDCCGHVIDHSRGEKIWATAISCGLFMYQLGACIDCRYWNAPETS